MSVPFDRAPSGSSAGVGVIMVVDLDLRTVEV